MLTNSYHYAFISAHYAHIMLDGAQRSWSRSGRIMLTNSTHYAFISAHYAHIMLEYPNRITGQENKYFNYLTFIIIIATSRKVQCSSVGYGSRSW